ncbi:MAG: glycosyltransferase family 2 protein [Pseudolabrys sp.]
MDAGGARSLQIFGAGYGSSPHVRKRKTASPGLRASDRAAELDRIRRLRGDRRAAALDVDADRMLIGASLRASRGLTSTWPKFSAATLDWRARATPVLLLLAFAALLATPSTITLSILVALPAAFRIWVVTHPTPSALEPSPDTQHEQEPLYSIIVPLRGEARVVDQLLSTIERLNYPPEKLDVIIAVEAKDDATRAAITARKHRIPITVIPVPAVGPAAKPKALNVALPFARGTFTVIYDAEARPERNQLRAGLKVFQAAGDDLACVQARSCIDTQDKLARTLFHRRACRALRRISSEARRTRLATSAWRLFKSFPHSDAAQSRRLGPSQRHGRCRPRDAPRPLRISIRRDPIQHLQRGACGCRPLGRSADTLVQGLDADVACPYAQAIPAFRELGFGSFLAFQLIVGGNALVALVHPIFMLRMIFELLRPGSREDYPSIQFVLYLLIIAAGYLLSAFISCFGLAPRHAEKGRGSYSDPAALAAAFNCSMVGGR